MENHLLLKPLTTGVSAKPHPVCINTVGSPHPAHNVVHATLVVHAVCTRSRKKRLYAAPSSSKLFLGKQSRRTGKFDPLAVAWKTNMVYIYNYCQH